MSRILPILAVTLTLSLTACADSTSTTARRSEHADASLGSHVPRTNAAASQDQINPAVAGERAFAGGAAGGSNNAGSR